MGGAASDVSPGSCQVESLCGHLCWSRAQASCGSSPIQQGAGNCDSNLDQHDHSQGPTDPLTGYDDDLGNDNDHDTDNDYDDDTTRTDTTMTTTARIRTTLLMLQEELSSFGRCCVCGSQLTNVPLQ